jgi:hypothetical protein
MAVAAAAPNAAGGGPPAAAEGGGWIGGLQQAVRTLALLMLFSNLSKTFLGGSQSGTAVSSSSPAGGESGSGGGSFSSSLYGESHAKAGLYRGRLHPLWREHTPMVKMKSIEIDESIGWLMMVGSGSRSPVQSDPIESINHITHYNTHTPTYIEPPGVPVGARGL